jgi:hypothetical protein
VNCIAAVIPWFDWRRWGIGATWHMTEISCEPCNGIHWEWSLTIHLGPLHCQLYVPKGDVISYIKGELQ